MNLASGLVIAGKFRLEKRLASGGMGALWVARHLQLDVLVAIKFMDPSHAHSTLAHQRFEREARAAASLRSNHVVQVQDYGMAEGMPYIAMELLHGEDLGHRLKRESRLSLPKTARILSQAARGLRRAHELGIVHRDIKPANIFLARPDGSSDEEEEVVKLLDFGIAKEMMNAAVGEGTKTGDLIGSPHYMSPEQIRGIKDLDTRSDLWSLGVIVFRAITGRLPFVGEKIGAVIADILTAPLPRPTDVAPDLPPVVDGFFERAFARDRDMRFQTAREMAEAFAAVVHGTAPPPSLLEDTFSGAPSSRSPWSEIPLTPDPVSGSMSGGGRAALNAAALAAQAEKIILQPRTAEAARDTGTPIPHSASTFTPAPLGVASPSLGVQSLAASTTMGSAPNMLAPNMLAPNMLAPLVIEPPTSSRAPSSLTPSSQTPLPRAPLGAAGLLDGDAPRVPSPSVTGSPIAAPVAGSPLSPLLADDSSRSPSIEPPPLRRRVALGWIAAATALLIVGVMIGVTLRPRSRGPASEGPERTTTSEEPRATEAPPPSAAPSGAPSTSAAATTMRSAPSAAATTTPRARDEPAAPPATAVRPPPHGGTTRPPTATPSGKKKTDWGF
jgi:eukaryotic-like serine/threonine-protein kinase